MIKVYLDWNVISGMRNNNFNEFKDIILNKNKFLLVYSSSHISDIHGGLKDSGQELSELIVQDLEYLSQITEDLFIYNDSDQTELEILHPLDVLNGLIIENEFFNDFSIDKLVKSISEDDLELEKTFNIFKNVFETILIDEDFKKAFKNPENVKEIETLFPGLENDFTPNGLFRSFLSMLHNLNENEDYNLLRQAVQKIGVNSGHFNDNINPFDVINNAYKKMGMESVDMLKFYKNSKNVPDYFNKISNEYLILDIHGFKADKIKVTDKKKQTFKNMTNDAFHSGFASLCEFYITNDHKNYLKTKAVYKKLNINTKVLKPKEFIKYYYDFLDYHTLNDHINSVISLFNSAHGFQDQKFQNGELFGYVNYTNEYFLNFFNKVLLPKNERSSQALFILSKENPSKQYLICLKEIEGVVKILVDALGNDINGKSYLNYDEIKVNNMNWDGRIWDTNNGKISISRINGWYHFELYPL
jgi:hypothetical protein